MKINLLNVKINKRIRYKYNKKFQIIIRLALHVLYYSVRLFIFSEQKKL